MFLKQLTRSRTILLLVAVLLVFSLSLHMIEFDHHHPRGMLQSGVQAYFHGGDKKLWAILLFLASISGLLLFLGKHFSGRTSLEAVPESFRASRHFNCQKLFDPLRLMFRKGILHPKLCD